MDHINVHYHCMFPDLNFHSNSAHSHSCPPPILTLASPNPAHLLSSLHPPPTFVRSIYLVVLTPHSLSRHPSPRSPSFPCSASEPLPRSVLLRPRPCRPIPSPHRPPYSPPHGGPWAHLGFHSGPCERRRAQIECRWAQIEHRWASIWRLQV